MNDFTDSIKIVEIEECINVFRNIEGVNAGCLGKKARCLADVYGEMIFFKLNEIPRTQLSENQLITLTEARNILCPAKSTLVL